MSGEDSDSLLQKAHRLRRGNYQLLPSLLQKRFPILGGFFIGPEVRGQAVTQGGR